MLLHDAFVCSKQARDKAWGIDGIAKILKPRRKEKQVTFGDRDVQGPGKRERQARRMELSSEITLRAQKSAGI